MPVPNTFANATTSIPLSQLDQNFATAITLGNTAIQLGNTVTTLNNMTLANVTVSSGNVTVTSLSGAFNGTVGATTPNTGAFTTLSATGTISSTAVAALTASPVTGTNSQYFSITNTGGSLYLGVSNSTGTGLASGLSAYDTVLYTNNATNLWLGVNGAGVTKVSSTGLAVTGTASATGSVFGADYYLGSTSTSTAVARVTYSGSVNSIEIEADPNNLVAGSYINFKVDGSAKARIDASGNLLVGTTSTSTYYRSQFINTGATAAGLMQNDNSGESTLVVWNAATSGDNKFVYFATEAGGTGRGSIDYNRAVGLTRYNTTSDGTLKNKLGAAPIEVSKNIVLSAPISEFAWKDDPEQRPQIGPIAQELYAVFPGAVSVGGMVEREVTDEEGNTTIVEEYQPWGVDKTAFTFHLVVCVQDLYEQVETLKAKVAALEEKLEASK